MILAADCSEDDVKVVFVDKSMPNGSKTVSYTHLDVYKRQLNAHGKGDVADSFKVIAEFLVYKRCVCID